jgi:NitT/TauT family transport system ATP-binding protein
MLRFDDVTLIYPGTAKPVKALEHFSLSVDQGEPIALIGPSGCGKSTSLLLAAGLLSPTQGEVLVGGTPIDRPRLETALILQDFGLLPWKTVFENAALGLRIRHFSKAERQQRVEKALEQVGLADFARMYPGELSGGMRQRLALARTLALDVDIMLMDEPLSALDAMLREGLQDMLLELWRSRGYAQVLVTHSIEEAAFLGRRIVVLAPRPGRVLKVIDNPKMGALDYRSTEDFYLTCQCVREVLRGESGEAGGESAAGFLDFARNDKKSSGEPEGSSGMAGEAGDLRDA